MPAGLTIEVEADKAAIKAFMDALARYETATKRSMKDAVRSATIDLVRSLRARTRRSPKAVPRMEIAKSYQTPKWIRDSHGGKPIRRMSIIRWAKGENYLAQRYIYGGECFSAPRRRVVRRKGKVYNSSMVLKIRPFSEAQMRTEAQRVYGQIRNWGLAKKSWGWFMKSLFRKSMQDENPRALIKPGMVDGGIFEAHEVLPDGTVDRNAPIRCDINIVNKLEYIRKAMPPGVFAIAVQKATNLINKKIESGLRSRRFRA